MLVQLYETFSHLNFAVQTGREPADEYLRSIVAAYEAGWWVDFSADHALNFPSARVSVPASKLLLGFGNAWTQAAPGTPRAAVRNTLVAPSQIGTAFEALERADPLSVPRGVFYWVLASEGDAPAGSDVPLWFGKEVNEYLRVRSA